MLHIVKKLRELDFRALMEVYTESNLRSASEHYPALPEGQAVLQVEQEFYAYLWEVFFHTDGAYYAVWLAGGRYVSALRMEPYKDGMLLEALETAPDHRRRGFAEQLLRGVLKEEKKVYSHVEKRNIPSLRTHEKCGFRRISQQAVYIDGSVNGKCCTLCAENRE